MSLPKMTATTTTTQTTTRTPRTTTTALDLQVHRRKLSPVCRRRQLILKIAAARGGWATAAASAAKRS